MSVSAFAPALLALGLILLAVSGIALIDQALTRRDHRRARTIRRAEMRRQFHREYGYEEEAR